MIHNIEGCANFVGCPWQRLPRVSRLLVQERNMKAKFYFELNNLMNLSSYVWYIVQFFWLCSRLLCYIYVAVAKRMRLLDFCAALPSYTIVPILSWGKYLCYKFCLHFINRKGSRFGHDTIVDGMLKDGLWDVYNDFGMGVCAEICANQHTITREEQVLFCGICPVCNIRYLLPSSLLMFVTWMNLTKFILTVIFS